MISIDIKYLRLLPLDQFCEIGNYKFNFRCPVCGDSKKSKFKKRGNACPAPNDNTKLIITCYNCSYASIFSSFLFTQNRELFKQYKRELIEEKYGKKTHKSYDIKPIISKKKVIKKEDTNNIKGNVKSLLKLDYNHIAIKYLNSRCIDKKYWRKIFYVENYKKWINDNYMLDMYKNVSGDDQRLVFPIYNKTNRIIGFQGRSLNPDNNVRYLTVKLYDNEDMVYGMENIDFSKTTYLVEGIFDKFMLSNSIAMLKSTINFDFLKKNFDDKTTFIFDNEKRNIEIRKNMNRVAEMSEYGLFVWNKRIMEKDLNLLIQNNKNLYPDGIMELVRKNTFYGKLRKKAALLTM